MKCDYCNGNAYFEITIEQKYLKKKKIKVCVGCWDDAPIRWLFTDDQGLIISKLVKIIDKEE